MLHDLDPGGPAGDPLATAVRVLAAMERRSPSLRDVSRDHRPFSVHGSVAMRSSVTSTTLPFPVSGQADGGVCVPNTAVAADLLMIGRPSGPVLRFRAFYLAARRTAVLHVRTRPWHRTGLLGGAAIQVRIGRGPIVVPTVLERRRSLRFDAVVEEQLSGRRFAAGEWPAAIPTAMDLLHRVWAAEPPGRRPIRQLVTRREARAVADLLVTLDAHGARSARLRAAIERLSDRNDGSLVGLTHGDPVHGNWLRLPDGTMALVDWELARRGVIGRDIMKLVLRVPDPVALLEAQPIGRPQPGIAPLRIQVAASLTAWLAGWRRDRDVAVRMGRLEPHGRWVTLRLDLLARLLDHG